MENNLLDAVRDMCRKNGSVCLVDSDFYRHFAELSDSDTEALLVDLVHANADSINRMVFAKPRTATDDTLIGFMKTLLSVVFHGFADINPDGSMGCFSPEGSPPTSEEEAALDRRIQSALPLIPKAIVWAVKTGKRDERSVSLGLQDE